jgi:hypothetical protein
MASKTVHHQVASHLKATRPTRTTLDRYVQWNADMISIRDLFRCDDNFDLIEWNRTVYSRDD